MRKIDGIQKIGKRVVVTGMAGAGKSTFSIMLSERTGLPVIHLDLHAWDPGWIRVPSNEFLEKQRQLLSRKVWIIDSNDIDDDLLLERADTLIIIATPWWICCWRAFRRGLKRPQGIQMPDGCEDSLLQRLKDEWGIVWRNWRNRTVVRAHDQALASRCRGSIQVYVLKTKQEIDRFMSAL